MAERMNGKAPYLRRTHGSERRGVTPVPALNFSPQLQQSRQEKSRVLELIKQRHFERLGIGNRELPAFKHKAELVANIDSHKATIVGGETGSGKSTQLPQFLYEAGYDLTIVLVPRRVIANGLGERIREEMSAQIEGFKPEEEIGIIHGERVEKHENNKIIVMTPNTYIKMAKNLREQFDGKKVAIIADEIHEANLFTEIAVGVAALSVDKQDNWRLIAASATHNADTLQTPFQKLNKGFVPQVEIKGRPFMVELKEEPELSPMQAYVRDSHAHEKAMIFTSGKNEINYIIDETARLLNKKKRGSSKKVVFRKLHGDLTNAELSHINDPVPEGYRLVIVSSPAGMSGITIPGVTYVASDGTINRSELDEDNASGLVRHMLSQAGVTQQIGRAGRDVPGGIGVLCKPVIRERRGKSSKSYAAVRRQKKEETPFEGIEYMPFEERPLHEPPEIYNTNLSRIVLSVAANGYKFAELNKYIPHSVRDDNIISAEEALARLGALDDDNKVTTLGIGMDKFPVRPELARSLYETMSRGKHKRTLQHMARAAFIAAAVDIGGIEDYDADEEAVRLRRQIIRHTSEDDFMIELDLMTKLYERTDENWTGYEFIERHGLHPKRVERVRKATKKILSVMDIRPENLIVTPPLPEEERLLRDDFTAGFIEFIYENTGKKTRSQQVLYRNIHGKDGATVRQIDPRSMANIPGKDLVAGIPRYFLKGTHKDGTPIKHDVLNHVFPVDPNVVGRYAMKNGLVQGVKVDARMVGDRAADFEQGMFGSILVGTEMKRAASEVISKNAQSVLVEHVLNNPGRVQQALRALANDLAGLRQRIPEDVLREYRLPNAPNDINQQDITEMIHHAAKDSVTAHAIDAKLAEDIYRNISMTRYYDVLALAALNKISPQYRIIAQEHTPLRYEAGQPYVTNLSKRQLSNIKEAVFLDDGREILFQRPLQAGGKERISFGSINE